MKTTDSFLTVAEVSKMFRVTPMGLHKMVRRHGIEFTRIARLCLLTPDDVRLLRKRQVKSVEARMPLKRARG